MPTRLQGCQCFARGVPNSRVRVGILQGRQAIVVDPVGAESFERGKRGEHRRARDRWSVDSGTPARYARGRSCGRASRPCGIVHQAECDGRVPADRRQGVVQRRLASCGAGGRFAENARGRRPPSCELRRRSPAGWFATASSLAASPGRCCRAPRAQFTGYLGVVVVQCAPPEYLYGDSGDRCGRGRWRGSAGPGDRRRPALLHRIDHLPREVLVALEFIVELQLLRQMKRGLPRLVDAAAVDLGQVVGRIGTSSWASTPNSRKMLMPPMTSSSGRMKKPSATRNGEGSASSLSGASGSGVVVSVIR